MNRLPEFVWLLDFVWCVIALSGAAYSARELNDTIIDRRVLAQSGLNGPRRVIATANMSMGWFRCVALSLLSVASLLQVLIPIEFQYPVVPWKLAVFRSALIGVTICLASKSFIARNARAQLMAYWMNGDNTDTDGEAA